MDPADMRRTYTRGELDEMSLLDDPLAQLSVWLDQARDAQAPEPNAMVLATATADGRPDARTVLCKGVDTGVLFYTNRTSAKGRELAANPRAALVFCWLPLERQVRLSGAVELVDDDRSDSYFASRPRESRLGAWASAQSEPIGSRQALDDLYAQTERRFADAGDDIPRPDFWGGYRLVPDAVEFWQGRVGRLHDRIRYDRAGAVPDGSDGWAVSRLQP